LLDDSLTINAEFYIADILSLLALRLVIIQLGWLNLRLLKLFTFLLQLLFLVFGQRYILSTILWAFCDFAFVWLGLGRIALLQLVLKRKRASYFHVKLFDKVSIVEHLGSRQLASLCDLVDLIISETNHYIFRFEIGVNDFALAMHIIKTYQKLSSQLSD
jgi:uncharacterized membrane protein YuzA (DUF378 family)